MLIVGIKYQGCGGGENEKMENTFSIICQFAIPINAYGTT